MGCIADMVWGARGDRTKMGTTLQCMEFFGVLGFNVFRHGWGSMHVKRFLGAWAQCARILPGLCKMKLHKLASALWMWVDPCRTPSLCMGTMCSDLARIVHIEASQSCL